MLAALSGAALYNCSFRSSRLLNYYNAIIVNVPKAATMHGHAAPVCLWTASAWGPSASELCAVSYSYTLCGCRRPLAQPCALRTKLGWRRSCPIDLCWMVVYDAAVLTSVHCPYCHILVDYFHAHEAQSQRPTDATTSSARYGRAHFHSPRGQRGCQGTCRPGSYRKDQDVHAVRHNQVCRAPSSQPCSMELHTGCW